MNGLTFIAIEDIQLVVAIKNATLFNPPSGRTPQIKVAINAKCNSVNTPAKFIINLSSFKSWIFSI